MLNDNILDWLKLLRERPQMVIPEPVIDYKTLRIYLEGYINGLDVALGSQLMNEITQFYGKKFRIETSYAWTGHIPFYFKGKSEDELKSILLDTTEEFFRKNLDWYKSEI